MKFLKLPFFKKGVRISASKSKAQTILNMIEINHGSHLPLKAFSATQPLLEFSKTPIYLFFTKHSPEGTIICLANPLYFPNKSIHFEKLSPRLDAFFFHLLKRNFTFSILCYLLTFTQTLEKISLFVFFSFFNILHTSLNLTLCFSLNSYYLDL